MAGCFMFWVVSYRRFLGLLLAIMTICGLSAASAHLVLFGPPGFWSPVNVTLAVVGTGVVAGVMYRDGISQVVPGGLGVRFTFVPVPVRAFFGSPFAGWHDLKELCLDPPITATWREHSPSVLPSLLSRSERRL